MSNDGREEIFPADLIRALGQLPRNNIIPPPIEISIELIELLENINQALASITPDYSLHRILLAILNCLESVERARDQARAANQQ